MTTVDTRSFDPAMRAVLDWLVRHEARCYDFSEVAQHAGMPRGEVEAAIVRLRHDRAGRALSDVGPDGKPLFTRTAYLRADSPHRDGKPAPVALPPPTNPLEAHAARRREKKAARDAYRNDEAARLSAARAEEKRGEKDARKAAQTAIRERLLSEKPAEQPTAKPPAAAPAPPPKKVGVTLKEAARG